MNTMVQVDIAASSRLVRLLGAGLPALLLSSLLILLAAPDVHAQYLNNCQCLYNGLQTALRGENIRPVKTKCRDISFGGDRTPYVDGYLAARDRSALLRAVEHYRCNPGDFKLQAGSSGGAGSAGGGGGAPLGGRSVRGAFHAWSVSVLPNSRTCPIGTVDQPRPNRSDKFCILPCQSGYLGYNFNNQNLLCVSCPAGTQSVRFDSNGAVLSCLQDRSGTYRWPEQGWRRR